MKRWGMTGEPFGTPADRRHCETLLGPVIDTLRALAEDSCAIECVVGVDGSPSCGVDRTCVGDEGGEPEDLARNGTLPSARLTFSV
jgi:predicted secreted protein